MADDGRMASPERRAGILAGAESDQRFGRPAIGDEQPMLVDFLAAQRATLRLKCQGLEAELALSAGAPLLTRRD
jgi:hypothetical protein